MSQEHVDEMNRLLATAPAVREAAGALDRRYAMTYALNDGPGAAVVHWTMSFTPDGVRFDLVDDPQADLRYTGDYADMVRSARAAREGQADGPGGAMVGDEAVLAVIGPVFAAAGQAATVPVEWPDV